MNRMTHPTHPLRSLILAAPLACLLLSGCHVTANDHGDSKNVDIGTPFGSMKVNTGHSTDTAAIGIASYPGATPIDDKSNDSSNNANISMNFGPFHLGVKAADFQTSDSQDKVLAFYRKDLDSRYGGSLECRGRKPIGSTGRLSSGLTCNDSSSHIDIGEEHHKGIAITAAGDSATSIELRTGSPQHLHIVGLEDRDGGTRISLVALDLPSHLSGHDRKDSE